MAVLATRALIVTREADPDFRGYLSDVLCVVETLLMCGGMVYAFRRTSGAGLRDALSSWRFFAFASASAFIAEAIWLWLASTPGEEAFPSVADFFYMAYYPLFLAAVLRLPSPIADPKERQKFLIGIAIGLLLAILLVGNFILVPSIESGENLSPLSLILALAYPLLDLAILWAVLDLLLVRMSRSFSAPLAWLALSAGAMIAGDMLFAWQTLKGIYQDGGPCSVLWAVSYLGGGYAGICQGWAVTRPGDLDRAGRVQTFGSSSWTVGVPYVALSLGLALLVWGRQFELHLGFGLVLAASLCIGLLMALRQSILWGEKRELYEHIARSRDELEVRVQERTRELREANEALNRRMDELARAEQHRRQLVSILEASGDFVGLCDPSGAVRYINRNGLRMVNFPADRCLEGLSIEDFHAPAEGQRLRESILPACKRDGLWMGELTLQWKDGPAIPVSVQSIAHRSATGEIEFYSTVMRDLRLQKAAEADRLAMESRVQETQKLESLGLLAGGIAHDFNNLLVGILGNADLALEETAPDAVTHPYLADIRRAALRAADLTNQMLAYSGRARFIIGDVNLNEIVEETVRLVSASISKKIAVEFALDPMRRALRGDVTQIRQVVLNLLTNAAEAIGDKSGTIRLVTGPVTVSAEQLKEYHNGETLAPGPYCMLRVEDTGDGMDAETARRIFEPFFTTKFHGRGLGLSAVLGILRGHLGGVRVSSRRGEGSTFTILLPCQERCESGTAPAPERTRAERATGIVLVVDDEEGVRSVVRRMLERVGLEVLTADNGRKGIQTFRENAHRLAAVVLDLTMPDLDGAETCREMQAIRVSVPVILMSGFSEQDVSVRFRGLHIAAFVQKPLDLAGLVQVLQSVLHPAHGTAPGAAT